MRCWGRSCPREIKELNKRFKYCWGTQFLWSNLVGFMFLLPRQSRTADLVRGLFENQWQLEKGTGMEGNRSPTQGCQPWSEEMADTWPTHCTFWKIMPQLQMPWFKGKKTPQISAMKFVVIQIIRIYQALVIQPCVDQCHAEKSNWILIFIHRYSTPSFI